MASSGKRSMIVAGCGDKVGVSRFSQAKEMVVSPGYFQISTGQFSVVVEQDWVLGLFVRCSVRRLRDRRCRA
jgi:hypothetical protein